MIDLLTDCASEVLSPNQLITNFDCGDSDLNDFFNNDFLFVFSTEQQERENLQKTYDPIEPLPTRQMFYDMIKFAYPQ